MMWCAVSNVSEERQLSFIAACVNPAIAAATALITSSGSANGVESQTVIVSAWSDSTKENANEE